MLDQHIYEHEEIVIGGSLRALVYSYLKNKPLIIGADHAPTPFEFFKPNFKLESFLTEPQISQLQTRNGEKKVGNSKLDLWKKINFILSLSGLIPTTNKASYLRVEDNILKVITANSRLIKFKFDTLTIFDDKNVYGLPTPKESFKTSDKKLILDWINVRSGMKHQYDYFKTNEDFVKEIHFYPSERLCGNHDKKDLVVISYLNKQELDSYEYSDTYVKFKVLKMMKEAGIKGIRNGRSMEDPTKFKYYAIKIEPTEREIIEIKKNVYDDTERFKFNYQTEEEIITENEIKAPFEYKSPYHLKLNNQFTF